MKEEHATMRIVILETSDVHGYMMPYSYVDGSSINQGLSVISSLINEHRQHSEEVLLIDNGDFLQGSPLTYHQAKVDQSRPTTVIECMNAMNYDAVVPGNHEFNFGKSYLEKAFTASSFPWLSANVLSEETGEPLFGTPYRIWEWDNGVRLAVLGLTTHYVPNWEHPNHLEGITFTNPIVAAKQWVPYLREQEQVDVVIVSYHGGFERDLVSGEPTESLTGENLGYALCEEVSGIDVLLSGHQHRVISGEEVAGVCVVQPGSEGQFVGKVTLSLQKVEHKWIVNHKQSEIVSCESFVADPIVSELTTPAENNLQQWLDQPIGFVEGDNMRILNPFQARMTEHPFIEWIQRVQMEISGAEISCTALFDDLAPGFDSIITMRDIMINYKYPNTLRVLRLEGRDIKAALERSAQYFHLNDSGDIEVSSAFLYPKTQHFNYDMWEGLNYTINVSKAHGERIVNLEREGMPILADKQYVVVMNNYRASGGGEYSMFKDKPIVKEISVDMVEILADYIRDKGTIVSTVNDNWHVISGA
ncbi:bifunctional metallophosphatase/5'-nucleotidase [Paenibacillus sp. IHBB 10380]|uniref:bifunctional metallophosphatase/5'-nucleotidase n=1 Tax=Paenibacillus sp. IHBB 10380 TaxID=1566358 RepID=UPI0005CFB59F|nr:bifunctional UDP-sugar hydrolase/5'-nucleotidase [Paenibacillus sp. IHBB 10380]